MYDGYDTDSVNMCSLYAYYSHFHSCAYVYLSYVYLSYTQVLEYLYVTAVCVVYYASMYAYYIHTLTCIYIHIGELYDAGAGRTLGIDPEPFIRILSVSKSSMYTCTRVLYL